MLVFVPLLAGHQLKSPAAIGFAVLAFFAFGLCALYAYSRPFRLARFLEYVRLRPRQNVRPHENPV